jgi:hypothetical protein
VRRGLSDPERLGDVRSGCGAPRASVTSRSRR